MPTTPITLTILGGGNMGSAIIAGATAAGFVAPSGIAVCEPDAGKRAAIARLGIRTTDLHAEALADLDDNPGRGFVLLAVKPQSLPELARQIRGQIPPSCGIISILAGTPIDKLADALARRAIGGIIRAMPNTPAAVRLGMTALAHGPGVSDAQRRFATGLFASVGDTVTIDEPLMDAFTALAGSGPAYVCYLAEALIRAGREAGFDHATADRIVRQTIAGASALIAKGQPPETLRAAVTSRGGTTQAAISILDDRAVMQAIVDAVLRARDRGRELGSGPA